MPRTASALLALAVVALTVTCTACGGDESFTSEEVADAFARHGIPLFKDRAGEQGVHPLLFILKPSTAPTECLGHLEVSIFSDGDEVDAHLARVGFTPGESRYVTESEDGEQVVGLVRDNVLAALTESGCYSEARVRTALDALAS
jgi:hypothetical protein